MSISPSTSYRLEFTPQAVTIGAHEIPIGKALGASIHPEEHKVRIWCEEGAMGLQREVGLNFYLHSAEKVAEFVKGLFSQTQAYLFSVAELKTQWSEGKMSATFQLSYKDQTDFFIAHVASFYFPDYQIERKGNVNVVVTSPAGEKAKIITEMTQAFANLNIHTVGTLYEALIRNREIRFLFPYTKKPEEATNARAINFNITPEKVEKEHRGALMKGHRPGSPYNYEYEMKPLQEFKEEEAAKAFQEMQQAVQAMEKGIAKYPSYKDWASLLALGKSAIAKGQPTNAVAMEVLTNQLFSLNSALGKGISESPEDFGLGEYGNFCGLPSEG